MESFKTHTGEVVSGKRLKKILRKIADEHRKNAKELHASLEYAEHVTQKQKDDNLKKDLQVAKFIEAGEVGTWALQRIDAEVTGESIALLP